MVKIQVVGTGERTCYGNDLGMILWIHVKQASELLCKVSTEGPERGSALGLGGQLTW